ncbi:PAS domain S-box protein [Roseateles saccharophilus]|uniref:histidine kinase n=1 Tax=Roseateles saccharophilus TaxID=304 RepID=A0A4R3UK40_ROSSA|nr:PAS domain S-box protein [Roseateles saccharophilus]MDG0834307.1 PAS domain S-box protein [Roseateles saccharophilus]TCU90673.1 PAS domain S-box-containing protein [Roseateles saccharophilus]
MELLPPAPSAAGPAQAVDDLTVYRSLFSAYPDALLLVDAAGLIVLANPAAAALLGYPAQELIGLGVDELVPDSIRPRHAAYRQAYGQAPRPRPMGTQMELVAKRRDGSEVMVEIALSPLQSHGLPFVVAAIRGIGAYPRVKQALQRARHSELLAQLGRSAVDERDPQQLLMQALAVAADALEVEFASVLLLDPDRLAFRVVGCCGEMAGAPVGSGMDNRPDTAAGYVLSQGGPVVVADLAQEARFELPQAYVEAGVASLLAVPLSDRGRIIGVLSVQSRSAGRFGSDDTLFLESLASLLATCLQRAQSEEALSHAQRLESVGQLTGGIAHDFNNLLTVIQGNLQVLEELPALARDKFGQQLVGAATRAARRGAELTGKLLAFSRRQVLQPSTVDVGAMLDSLADMLRRTLDQRIEISVDLADPAASTVQADPGQLEAALLNIAINARDAMPDGGALRFAVSPASALPADVRREIDDPGAADDGFLRIAIYDTGAGMPEEVRERAFEPFFTTKQAGRGTGLGLSTVYGFVKQSRGAVAIDSAPGAGTTISLYLPRPLLPEGAAGGPAGSAGPIPPGLKVLMVEDDTEVRSVAWHFLGMLGCEVTSCASGEQALLLLVPGAGFQLLLTDIALGSGMRGTELARLAQARLPGLPILLMSGFSAELLDADRDSPPGWELLQKPYSRGELAQAISRALSAGS